MPIDGNVEKRVGKDDRGQLITHKADVIDWVQSVAAKKSMLAQIPRVSQLAHSRPCILGNSLCRVLCQRGRRRKSFDKKVDLCHLKSCGLQVEVQLDFG